jgi:chromosomal replication initiator protein
MEDVRSGGSEKKMSTMSDDLWQARLRTTRAELPEQQFNTWIRPLPPADIA